MDGGREEMRNSASAGGRIPVCLEVPGMKLARPFVVAVLALTLLTWASLALADDRVALVVGNSAYAHIGRLPNADNDARDLSAALRRLGFEVTTELDAGRGELNEALRAFTRQSLGADVSLVFYAGHGMEMDGANYLVPVDARLERDGDVRFETVTLEDMLASTLGASLRLVILDACRNNPLARSMQRTLAGRSVSGGSFGDLNEDLLGDETLVAYAAAAGTTAADGRGRNSPYTAALLAHLEQPVEIGLLFRRVRAQVLASTNGQQRPHEYQSLVGEHYLSVPPTAESVTVEAALPVAVVDAPVVDAVAPEAVDIDVAAPEAATATAETNSVSAALVEQDTTFWRSIVDSDNPADFEAYLRQFPAGAYRALATNRLVAPQAVESDPPSTPVESRPSVPDPREVSRIDELSEMLGRPLSPSRGDDNGWTDLHYAAALNLPDVVTQLVNRGANVNARIHNDGIRLGYQLRQILRRRLAETFDRWTRDGETPLHIAAIVGAQHAASALVERGAAVDARTEFRWTPLHYAAWADAAKVAEVLLSEGADMNAETEEYTQNAEMARTPLRVAEQAGSSNVAAVLRARRARR